MKPAREAGTAEGGEGGWERGMEGEGGAVGLEGKAVGLPQEASVIKAIRQVLCHGDKLPEVSSDPKDTVSPNGMGKRDEAVMQVHTVTLTRPVINDRGQDVIEKVVPKGGRLGDALFPTSPQRDRVGLRALKTDTEGDVDQLPESSST